MKKIVLLTILFLLNVNFTFSQNTYPNGQIMEKGNQQNGEWIQYFENGQIMTKVNFVNGLVNGESIEYFENGLIKTKGNYINGKMNEEWSYYNEKGQIVSKKNWVDDRINGEQVEYYENGQMKEKVNYVGSLPDGECIYYNENGKLISKIYYVKGKKIDSIKYDSDGELKNGEEISYGHQDRSMSSKRNYLNGKMNGEEITYYPGGKIIDTKTNYINGKPVGEKIEYFQTNDIKIKSKIIFDSLKRGDYTCYYENGKIKEEGKVNIDDFPIVNLNRKFGKIIGYYPDGQKKFLMNSNGKLISEIYLYYPNGKVCVKYNFIEYKNSEENFYGTQVVYDLTGNKIGEYINTQTVNRNGLFYNFSFNYFISSSLEDPFQCLTQKKEFVNGKVTSVLNYNNKTKEWIKIK
jgi:antitoxin component YwqK of YwqJK toxin-antitoxin module